jgi:hypothetical protein
MPCPQPIADLLALLASVDVPPSRGIVDVPTSRATPGLYPSQNGEVESFIAPAGCLNCGGVVLYRFFNVQDVVLSGLADDGHCLNCGTVERVTERFALIHHWQKSTNEASAISLGVPS